jgi:hypothetical protein
VTPWDQQAADAPTDAVVPDREPVADPAVVLPAQVPAQLPAEVAAAVPAERARRVGRHRA